MTKIYLPFLLSLLTLQLLAQPSTFECGTAPGITIDRLKHNIQHISQKKATSETQYLPVSMTILSEDNGGGRLSEEDTFDALCTLNANFEYLGIQFYLSGGIRYISDSDYYLIWGEESKNLRDLLIPNTLNILVGEILSTGSGCNGVLGFYSYDDYVAMDRCVMNKSSHTLTHELGHFFSLPHTFFGWEDDSYNSTEPTPTTTSWGIEVEYADGRNCAVAADMICDTPPDYGFSSNVCVYNRTAYDPAGEIITPDEKNYMSYFFGCDEFHFSEMQGDVMLSDIDNRNFISESHNFGHVTETGTLTAPVNDAIVSPDNVVLTWEPVDNAEQYIVEINRLASFSPILTVERVIVDTPTFTATELNPNSSYHWRIKPFSRYSTCVGFSEGQSFKTDNTVDVEYIEGIESFEVYPNPITGGQKVNLILNTQQSFDADISLYDVQGKAILEFEERFNNGSNTVEIDTNDIAKGAYIIAIRSESGVLHQRLLIR